MGAKKKLSRPKGSGTSVVARPYNFFCRTYLNEIQLKLLLLQHSMQIRTYAYALHDQDRFKEDQVDKETGDIRALKGDLKEPHYHIILICFNGHSLSAVKRWFTGWVDSDNKPINTDVRACSDINAAYDYLTHNTQECFAAGDFLYDKSIIVTNNEKQFRGHFSADLDRTQLLLLDMYSGTSYAELAMKYGAHFILNIGKFEEACEKIYYNTSFTRIIKEREDLRNVVRDMDKAANGEEPSETEDEYQNYTTQEVEFYDC